MQSRRHAVRERVDACMRGTAELPAFVARITPSIWWGVSAFGGSCGLDNMTIKS
jgi:hypothetical protein